jgi:hypothetical protein
MSYQRKHLLRRLMAEKQILAIIQREKDKSFRRKINYVLGKPRERSCYKVQVEQEDGTVIEHSSQEDLQNAIWTNNHKRDFIWQRRHLCALIP